VWEDKAREVVKEGNKLHKRWGRNSGQNLDALLTMKLEIFGAEG